MIKKDAKGYVPCKCKFCGWIGRPATRPGDNKRKAVVLTCTCCGNDIAMVPRTKEARQNGSKEE